MRDSFLPFAPPDIGEEEIREVVQALTSSWITTGPRVRQFEEEFAAAFGAEGALALNSCTAALHVALAALGVGEGDEVIATPMTFCSSIHVIEHMRARPVLVDVEPDTMNMDPGQVERALSTSKRARAIMPVHLHGHPADLDPLLDLAEAHRLAVVEDAAHALPASYRGRPIGTPSPRVPNLVAFSFYATKNLTTGEGGMLTGPPETVDDARIWSLHGMSRDAYNRYGAAGSWQYEVLLPGFKYNMTDIAAAMGLQQLRRLDALQERRRAIVAAYDAALSELDWLDLPARRPDVEHAWHIYAIRLRPDALTIDRARFITELRDRNIGASVHFIPVHLLRYYREKYGYQPEDFPVACREFHRMLSLPLSPRMTDDDAGDVVQAVIDIGRRFRR